MAKRIWPKCALADLFEDWIVYRNLRPLDRRIPGLEQVAQVWGLPQGWVPRKAKDPEYVCVLIQFIAWMQHVRNRPSVQHLIYVGNRQSRDQATLRHWREWADVPVFSFLCEEDLEQAAGSTVDGGDMAANRWGAMADFAAFLRDEHVPLSASTAVVVDMDKTIIAARGRNSEPLNRSRVEGVQLMVQDVLGEAFEEPRFRAVYGELNQAKYHFFTEDNQDYVTYAALIASALIYSINDIVEDLAYERFTTFGGFLDITRELLEASPRAAGLWPVYQEVAARYAQRDPTVFKSFRAKQYESTLRRLDRLPADAPEEALLAEEIVITREVWDWLDYARRAGASLLLISDRPDESLIPSEALRAQGCRPVHQLPLKVVGQSLAERLPRIGHCMRVESVI